MTLSMMTLNATAVRPYAECCFMLSVTIMSFMPNVVMLSAIILNVIELNVIELNVVALEL